MQSLRGAVSRRSFPLGKLRSRLSAILCPWEDAEPKPAALKCGHSQVRTLPTCSRVWSNPNAFDSTDRSLGKALKRMQNSNRKYEEQKEERKRNEDLQKQREIVSRRLEAESRRIELEAIHAMAGLLEKGQVLLTDYGVHSGEPWEKTKPEHKFKVQGVVIGEWRREEVIVFVEVNKIMTSPWASDALWTMDRCVDYWSRMVKTGRRNNMDKILNSRLAENFRKMKVEAHGHRKVMVGFGAVEFPDEVLEQFKGLPPWFRIKHNSNGEFVATLEEMLADTDIECSSSSDEYYDEMETDEDFY